MEHVLVIGENPVDSDQIRIYLDDMGFRHKFFHSTSLENGLNLLKENEIDIVLLDLSQNGQESIDTLNCYLKEAPEVPVIILTANNNEVAGLQAVKAGAQDYLNKGALTAKRLVSSIRYSIQRYKAQAKAVEPFKNQILKEKFAREAHQKTYFGNWEMDIVNYAMKWSDETFRIFGYQPNSFDPALSDYLDYVHPDDKEKVNEFFEEVIKSGHLSRIEHRIVINNRTLKYLLVQAGVKYDEFSENILLTGSVQDVTYQKDNQIESKEVTKDNNVDKTSRFNQLSYDIRTPLSSIFNLLYLLEKSNFTNQQRELIEDLKTSVDDLSVVLNNLLNYALLLSKDLRVQEEVFNLGDVLKSVVRSGRFKTEQAELNFEHNIQEELPVYVVGDESKIQQVLLNLLEWAVMHTVGGNKIVMEAEMATSEMLQVKFKYPGNCVHVDFLETDGNENLTELIFSDSQEDQYTLIHLGTFIASKLSRLLNGSLYSSCNPHQQCVLIFKVPLQISDFGDKINISGEPNKRINILLVEDHFLNQIATKKVLTSWSDFVNVVTADNGEEAIHQFEKERIDLILMDLKIPKISGIEAARMIREKSNVPIIALTASSSKQEEERCFTVGMNAYIPKPIRPEELYAKINQLLN